MSRGNAGMKMASQDFETYDAILTQGLVSKGYSLRGVGKGLHVSGSLHVATTGFRHRFVRDGLELFFGELETDGRWSYLDRALVYVPRRMPSEQQIKSVMAQLADAPVHQAELVTSSSFNGNLHGASASSAVVLAKGKAGSAYNLAFRTIGLAESVFAVYENMAVRSRRS